MTRSYMARVEIRQIIEVGVAAATETDARRRAKDAAFKQVPGADVWLVEPKLQGETKFEVGSKIPQAFFSLVRMPIGLIVTTGQIRSPR